MKCDGWQHDFCRNEVSYGCRLSLQDRGQGRALGQCALCFTPTAGHLRPTVGSVCVGGESWNSPITPVRGQTLREGALWSTLEEAYSS